MDLLTDLDGASWRLEQLLLLAALCCVVLVLAANAAAQAGMVSSLERGADRRLWIAALWMAPGLGLALWGLVCVYRRRGSGAAVERA